MKKNLLLLFSLVSTALMLASCTMPARKATSAEMDLNLVATNVQQTIEALYTTTSFPVTGTPTSGTVKTTATQKATQTLITTITPTYSAPMLSFDNNVNCRQGPGTTFKVVLLIQEGQKVDVVGVQDKYWIVKLPNSTETCWLPAEFATPEGSVWTVPTVGAPDIPTETPPLSPGWKKWNYFCSFTASGTTLTMEMEWIDKNNNETGFRVLRDGQSVAELGADSSSFTDTVTVENGQSFNYSIETYRGSVKSTSSVVNASCQ